MPSAITLVENTESQEEEACWSGLKLDSFLPHYCDNVLQRSNNIERQYDREMRGEDWGSKCYFFFLKPCWLGMWALSSMTRDGSCAPCIASVESYPLNCLGSPSRCCFGLYVKDIYIYIYLYTAVLGKNILYSKKGSSEFLPPQRAVLPTLPSHLSTPLLPHFFLSANSDTTYSSRMTGLKTPPPASSLIGSCGLYSLSFPPPMPTVFYSYN